MIGSLIAQIENTDLPGDVRIVAAIVTVLLLVVVLELVRRRRLVERYALIWILASLGMVVLAVWQSGLDWIGNRLGVADPVNGIFLIAFAVVFGLLLNFSVAVSRLSEETKILAQIVSRLDAELRELRRDAPHRNGGDPDPRSEPGRAGGPDRSAPAADSDEG